MGKERDCVENGTVGVSGFKIFFIYDQCGRRGLWGCNPGTTRC